MATYKGREVKVIGRTDRDSIPMYDIVDAWGETISVPMNQIENIDEVKEEKTTLKAKK